MGPSNPRSCLDASVCMVLGSSDDLYAGTILVEELCCAATDHLVFNAVKLTYAGNSCLMTTGDRPYCASVV